MPNLLWWIVVILVVCWLAGFGFGFGGGLIHLLLIVIVIVVIFQLLQNRRA